MKYSENFLRFYKQFIAAKHPDHSFSTGSKINRSKGRSLKREIKMDEKTVYYLEESIPELAETAVKQAYWRAIAAGCSVLITENGMLIEVHPDGTKKIIKKLAPPIPVKKGLRLEIK